MEVNKKIQKPSTCKSCGNSLIDGVCFECEEKKDAWEEGFVLPEKKPASREKS